MEQTNNLTQSQTLLWTGQVLHPESPMYNMAMAFDIEGQIDTMAFRRAFQAMVSGSDVLRTVILMRQDMPYQVVRENLTNDLEIIDFSTSANPEIKLKNWLKNRSQQVFDIQYKTFDSALIKISERRFIWYFNQHHLVTDGWSLTILYQKMAELYKIALEHADPNKLIQAAQLPDFQNFIQYEKSIRSKPVHESVKQYWQKKLAAIPDLPRLYGEVGDKTASTSERIPIDLGRERSDQLRALTKAPDLRAFTESMSLFHIFSTVLFAYLYRVTGQQNLVVGTPSHNRPTMIFKQTPGVFMEIFPMQAEVSPDDSFMDLFQRIRTEANNYLKNAQLGASSPDLSRSFNVLLNFISGTFGHFNGFPMQSDWILPGHTDPQHQLRLQIHDFDATGRIQLHFDMNTTVFDEVLRQKAPWHFIKILDHFLQDRTQPLMGFSILDSGEEAHLLSELNATHQPAFPTEPHLMAYFEKQVEKTPDLPALIFENQEVSYQQLNQKANQLGHFLRRFGVREGDIVAIIMHRGLELPVAIYSILKAGAAYLPIDPQYPSARIDFMLENAGAKYILTDSQFESIPTNKDHQRINMDQIWSDLDGENPQNLQLAIEPESLAYIIYTSGSTGQPKGAMIEQKSICNRIDWAKSAFSLNESDRYLQKTPFTFDVSVPEFFWPLQVGAALVIAAPEGHKDPVYLKQTIEKYGVTILHFVPSMLAVFLEGGMLEKCASLRRVICSGEAISVALQERFFDHFDIELQNLYGPTEAAVDVTHWICQRGKTTMTVPIGKPVANTQIYILDENRRPVPQGVPGELYIGGIQVGRGYINNPQLTKERFVVDPFAHVSGATMYRSGDLARYRKDGVIEYLGRVDFQVKLRGFRIELGEIEAILERHKDIHQAVILLHHKTQGAPYLVAYYTADHAVPIPELTAHLAAHLPDYMIPADFLFLSEFPVNTNGKTDRKALMELPVSEEKITKTAYVEPRNEIEALLVDIWEEVLEKSPIGVFDNFFELGGHSLTAIRLVSRIIENLELTLPISLVFQKPTIAAYAEHIEITILQLMEEMDAAENSIEK